MFIYVFAYLALVSSQVRAYFFFNRHIVYLMCDSTVYSAHTFLNALTSPGYLM